MADIKGLSILMNMKDVGVERSLKQIKAQFKTLSSEMNRSNNDFKQTERSMTSLSTRTKDLKKGIEVTRNSMKEITNQLRKMSDEERRSSVEAEKLRLEYSRQHKALNMYERQLNQTENEMNQFGQSTKRTVFSIQKIDNVLGTVRKQLNITNMAFERGGKSTLSYENHLKGLNAVISKHEAVIRTLETRYQKVARQQGVNSHEALDLRQKILMEKQALDTLQNQYNQTSAEAKQFGFEQRRGVQSVTALRTSISQIGNALKLTNAQFNGSNQSTMAYRRHVADLSSTMENQRAVVQNLGRQYAYARREYGANSKEAQELGMAYYEEKQKLKSLDTQLKETTIQSKRFAMEQRTAALSMSDIKQKITQVAQSLRISANNFKLTGQTASAYKAKISELNNSMKQQHLIVQSLSKQYEFAKAQYGSTSKEAQELGVQLSEERLKLKNLGTELNQTTQAHKRLQMEQKQGVASMTQLRQKMTDINNALSLSRSNYTRAGESVKAYKTHLFNLKTAMTQEKAVLNDLNAQYKFVAQSQGKNSEEARELAGAITQQKIKMNELETEIEQTGKAYTQLALKQKNAMALTATGFGRSMQAVNKYKDTINSAGLAMRNMGSNMAMYVSLPVVAGFGAAIKKGMDFEGQMSRVGAIAGSSKNELKAMSDQALQLGQQTSLSASEVAQGMEELAALGMNTNQVMSAMPGVISAAEASGAELSETATIMASSLNSFNLKASDSSHVADVLAVAANKSAADVNYMGEALKYAGPPANSLGMTLEDTSGAIMAMSNAGLKGEQAGTTLRASLIKLAKPTKASQKAMDELGISLTDSKGKFVGMPALIGQFEKGLQGMTKEQKLAAVSQVVGTESASGFLAMINAGPDKIGKYSKALKDSNGASKEAAKQMKDNLQGDIEQLGGAFETLGIKIMQTNGGPLRALAQALTNLVSHIADLPGPVLGIITVFAGLAASIGPILIGLGLMANGITSIATAVTTLNTLGAGAGIFAGLKTAIGTVLGPVGQLISKIPLIGGAMTSLMGPIGIAIAAIAAIGVALVVAYKKSETFRNIVNGALQGVGKAFQFLWNGIKSIGAALAAWWNSPSGIGGTLSRFWNENGPMLIQAFQNILSVARPIFMGIWNVVSTAFNGIKTVIVAVMQSVWLVLGPILQGIGRQFMNVWNLIKATTVNVFNLIKGVIQGALNVILGIVKIFGGIFTGNWRAVWDGVKMIGLGIMQIFVSAFKFLFNQLLAFVKFIGASIKNAFVTSFNVMKGLVLGIINVLVTMAKASFNNFVAVVKFIFTGLMTAIRVIWNAIKFAIITPIKTVVSLGKALFNGFKNTVITVFNVIRNHSGAVWNGIKNTVVGAARALVNGVKILFYAMKTAISVIFNTIKTIAFNVWNSIKTRVVTLARALYTGARNNFNLLKTAVTVIFNAIRNFAINVWNAIKNRVVNLVKGLYNGAKNNFNLLRKAVTSIFNAIKSFAVSVWNSIKNRVVSLAKGLYTAVRNHFTNLNNTQRRIFNAVKSFMVSIWNSIKSKVSNLTQGLRDSVVSKFNSLKKGVTDLTGKVKSSLINSWEKIKSKLTGLATGIKDKVTGTFGKMRDGLASIIDKIKGHINGMVDKVKGGLNKLIDGINWVAGKIGMDKLPKFSVGTESTHTQNLVTNGKLNRDTFATVGDKGKGNGPGGFRHEMIRYPNGKTALTPNRDTTAFIPKGSTIYNGTQTHAMLSGNLPRFSLGSMKKWAGEKLGQGAKWLNATGTKAATKIVDTGKNVAKGASNIAKSALDKIGDVYDFATNPGKLVDKVLGAVGFNFDFLKGDLLSNLMKAATSKLKAGVTNLFKGWLDEGGGGDGSKLMRYPIMQRFGRYTGGLTFNGGRHYGVDFAYPYGSNVYSTNDGTLSTIQDYGGGTIARLITGQFTLFFMHLSKVLKQGKVKTGDLIAKSGNSGHFTTTPHLHFQVNKGHDSYVENSHAIEPLAWLKGHGGGGKSGKWGGNIKQALSLAGLPTSSAYVNAWQRQIQTESGGNPNAMGGTDGLADGRAQGLVQVKPGTFNAYKLPGHGNIMNGLDNLIAGMRYAKARYGGNLLSVIGHGHGYATGGVINSEGWYNLAEGGWPEIVIPTDPSKASDAMKLIAIASERVSQRGKNNKRPNQLRYPNTSANDSSDMIRLMAQQLEGQQQQIELLTKLVASTQNIEQQPKGFSERDVSKAQGRRIAMQNYTMGG